MNNYVQIPLDLTINDDMGEDKVGEIIYSYLRLGKDMGYNPRHFIKIYFLDSAVSIIIKVKNLFSNTDGNVIIYAYLFGLNDQKIMPVYAQPIQMGDIRLFKVCASGIARLVMQTIENLKNTSKTFKGTVNIYTNMDNKVPCANYDDVTVKDFDTFTDQVKAKCLYTECEKACDGDYIEVDTEWAIHPDDPEYRATINFELLIYVATVLDQKVYCIYTKSPHDNIEQQYSDNPIIDQELLSILYAYFGSFNNVKSLMTEKETLTTKIYKTTQEERI